MQSALRGSRGWTDAGAGWEVLEAELQLGGWSRSRRVVLVREAPALAPVGEKARRRRDYLSLPGTDSEDWSGSAAPWSGRSKRDRSCNLAARAS